MPSGIQIAHGGIRNRIVINKLVYNLDFVREIISQKFPQFEDISSSSTCVNDDLDTVELLDMAGVSPHFKSLNDSIFEKVRIFIFIIFERYIFDIIDILIEKYCK